MKRNSERKKRITFNELDACGQTTTFQERVRTFSFCAHSFFPFATFVFPVLFCNSSRDFPFVLACIVFYLFVFVRMVDSTSNGWSLRMANEWVEFIWPKHSPLYGHFDCAIMTRQANDFLGQFLFAFVWYANKAETMNLNGNSSNCSPERTSLRLLLIARKFHR